MFITYRYTLFSGEVIEVALLDTLFATVDKLADLGKKLSPEARAEEKTQEAGAAQTEGSHPTAGSHRQSR